ncbi:DUF2794 domain-containing protein [Hyphobacterium sp. HN65]|uniref:DUF2794 domain-containing protein n=1 Tax=Hyphobacterium lacteum TaxID=3116575 RepID=A0ABU7LS91_9PROT|nr:DUF2794 domain-containing protein [Hyphobacterium sp. HN65]MEE2526740.1 DUF2794 domain-containing protein [Hyphobacterium sp. HN65]
MRGNTGSARAIPVMFDRPELDAILRVYGRLVMSGDCKDYAIDGLSDRAVFSIFRRASEFPLYRIEKVPANARKQGAWKIIAPGGAILKRGHDLANLLKFFDKRRFQVID